MDWSLIIIADCKFWGLLDTLSEVSNTIILSEALKQFHNGSNVIREVKWALTCVV